jgi:hypothetical protein
MVRKSNVNVVSQSPRNMFQQFSLPMPKKIATLLTATIPIPCCIPFPPAQEPKAVYPNPKVRS